MELKKSSIAWTAASTKANIARKTVFTEAQSGQRKLFIVSRSGQQGVVILPVTTREGKQVMAANGSGPLHKKVYNLQAISAEAAIRLKPIFFDAGVEAENAGNAALAADLFNAFLNGSAISFNVLSTSSLYHQDLTSCEIEATLQVIKTDVGTLLTIDTANLKIVHATAGQSGAEFAKAFFGASVLPVTPAAAPAAFDATAIVS